MLQWYYFALISSLLLGLYSLIEKRALKTEHATAFTSTFSFVAAIISLPLLIFARFGMITPFQYLLIFANGIVIALTYLLAARVYRHGSISAAAGPFSALPSLFVALLAFFFLGERLALTQYISIIVISLVIYVLLFESSAKDFGSNKYKMMVILRCFLVAVEAILTKFLLGSVDVYAFLVLSELFVAFDFVIFISLKYRGMREIIETTRAYFVPIFLMAILTLGYSLAYYFSLLSADVSLVTPIRNTVFVVMTVGLGGILFKEKNLKRKLVLCAVLLAFAYILIA